MDLGKEIPMRRQILAGTTVLVLALALTTSATAFDHRDANGHHWRQSHRLVRGHGGQDAAPYHVRDTYTNLGPLGVMFGPPPRPGHCGANCVPGSSIAAWSY
jgi:hypothetical protein